MKDSPVAVCGARIGGIPELAETGFCIYDLQRLQDEFGFNNNNSAAAAAAPPPAVAALEVDFFRADAILQSCTTDEAVARLALCAVSAALSIDPIDPALTVDVSVVRARNAVSHFAVGSASCTPASVRLLQLPQQGQQGQQQRGGLYICGDWIDRTGHASWSTEKAVVTGRQAAAAVAADFGIRLPAAATAILPVAPDTRELAALRTVAQWVRSVSPPPPSSSSSSSSSSSL